MTRRVTYLPFHANCGTYLAENASIDVAERFLRVEEQQASGSKEPPLARGLPYPGDGSAHPSEFVYTSARMQREGIPALKDTP